MLGCCMDCDAAASQDNEAEGTQHEAPKGSGLPKGTYKVIVRVRPPPRPELDDVLAVEILSRTRLRVQRSYQAPLELSFDCALSPESGQAEVFKALRDVVEAVVEGRNSTIFTYGQTGSGKTHTMTGQSDVTGDAAAWESLLGEQRGLIPRALEHVFCLTSAAKRNAEPSTNAWLFGVSFMEIYNERVYDLLVYPETFRSNRESTGRWRRSSTLMNVDFSKGQHPDEKCLELLEGRNGQVSVAGLTSVEVGSLNQVLELLRLGTENRTRGDNGFHCLSSRSHAIFQLYLERRSKEDGVVVQATKLNLVDLAGSEKLQPHGQVAPASFQELTNINLSLGALGQCIAALVDPKRRHVPYRDSKLTRLLQDSLRGMSRTAMCICISPEFSAVEETLSSLKFADRAKRVVVDPIRSDPQASGSSKQVADLLLQVKGLSAELRTERAERMRLQGVLWGDGRWVPPEHAVKESSTSGVGDLSESGGEQRPALNPHSGDVNATNGAHDQSHGSPRFGAEPGSGNASDTDDLITEFANIFGNVSLEQVDSNRFPSGVSSPTRTAPSCCEMSEASCSVGRAVSSCCTDLDRKSTTTNEHEAMISTMVSACSMAKLENRISELSDQNDDLRSRLESLEPQVMRLTDLPKRLQAQRLPPAPMASHNSDSGGETQQLWQEEPEVQTPKHSLSQTLTTPEARAAWAAEQDIRSQIPRPSALATFGRAVPPAASKERRVSTPLPAAPESESHQLRLHPPPQQPSVPSPQVRSSSTPRSAISAVITQGRAKTLQRPSVTSQNFCGNRAMSACRRSSSTSSARDFGKGQRGKSLSGYGSGNGNMRCSASTPSGNPRSSRRASAPTTLGSQGLALPKDVDPARLASLLTPKGAALMAATASRCPHGEESRPRAPCAMDLLPTASDNLICDEHDDDGDDDPAAPLWSTLPKNSSQKPKAASAINVCPLLKDRTSRSFGSGGCEDDGDISGSSIWNSSLSSSSPKRMASGTSYASLVKHPNPMSVGDLRRNDDGDEGQPPLWNGSAKWDSAEQASLEFPSARVRSSFPKGNKGEASQKKGTLWTDQLPGSSTFVPSEESPEQSPLRTPLHMSQECDRAFMAPSDSVTMTLSSSDGAGALIDPCGSYEDHNVSMPRVAAGTGSAGSGSVRSGSTGSLGSMRAAEGDTGRARAKTGGLGGAAAFAAARSASGRRLSAPGGTFILAGGSGPTPTTSPRKRASVLDIAAQCWQEFEISIQNGGAS